LQRLKHDDQALQIYKNVINLTPLIPEANYNMAIIYSAKQEWDEAIKQFELSIKEKKYISESHNNIGAILYNTGKIEESKVHFVKSIETNSENKLAINNKELANKTK